MTRKAYWGFVLRAWFAGTLAALLLAGVPCALARADGDKLSLTGMIDSPATSTPRAWSFPYADALFLSPADQYNHTLARASLGMATSAFRVKNTPLENQGDAVERYLRQAGFADFSREDYNVTPTADTIATLIGRKTLSDGATVVAVAVCGGGYKNEWLSNFSIGDEERHAGFNAAAQKVVSRVRAYIESQGVTGATRLWISGYSRGAAVSNLTAADLTDSGLFERVYAYTFATPRVTRAPGAYPNIFNIVGKFDPVTCIPFAEWGFARNGVDLYTPAQETDSDYRQRKALADVANHALTGTPFRNSVEMNANLHTLLDYLLMILPDGAAYDRHMKPILLDVWQDKSLSNLLAAISRLAEETNLLDETAKSEVDFLLDYLSMATYVGLTGGADWNTQTGMADNLAHEHSPDVYVAWLFSTDDPGALYTNALDYMRLTVQGSVKINVVDDEANFILSVEPDGRVGDQPLDSALDLPTLPHAEKQLIAVQRRGSATILTLPQDRNYYLLMEATKTEPLIYFGVAYTVGTSRGDMPEVFVTDMEAGAQYAVISFRKEDALEGKRVFGTNDYAFSLWGEELPYSPSVIMLLENTNVFHLSFAQMAWLAGGAAALLLAALITTAILLVRRRKRRKRAAVTLAAAASAADGADADADASADEPRA